MTQFGGDRSQTEEAAGNSCSSFRQGGRLVQPTIRLSCRPPLRSATASDPISLPSKQVRFSACYFAHSDFASTTLFATSDNKRIWTGKRRKAAGGKKTTTKGARNISSARLPSPSPLSPSSKAVPPPSSLPFHPRQSTPRLQEFTCFPRLSSAASRHLKAAPCFPPLRFEGYHRLHPLSPAATMTNVSCTRQCRPGISASPARCHGGPSVPPSLSCRIQPCCRRRKVLWKEEVPLPHRSTNNKYQPVQRLISFQ